MAFKLNILSAFGKIFTQMNILTTVTNDAADHKTIHKQLQLDHYKYNVFNQSMGEWGVVFVEDLLDENQKMLICFIANKCAYFMKNLNLIKKKTFLFLKRSRQDLPPLQIT